MTEAQLGHDVLLVWGAHPQLRLWRVNTGVGWFVKGTPARKTDPGAYPVRFGLPGQADYSGLVLPHGQRLEIETKTERGVQSEAQKKWQRMVETFGGIYILARSVADVDVRLADLGLFR